MLRLAGVGGFLAYRALFNWTTPAVFVGSLLVAPVFQLLFFVYLGREIGTADDNFYVLGNVLLSATGACVMGGTMAIANERQYGTLSAVLLSPRSRILLWGGRALPYVVNALGVMLFTLFAAMLFVGIEMPATKWPELFLALLAGGFSATAFGIAIGSIGLRLRNTAVVANVGYTVMILLTGTVLPHERLPAWLAAVGDVLPLTHSTEAARACSAGAESSVILTYVWQEFLVGVGHTLVAAVLLRLFEWAGRRGRLSLDEA
ncbi:ABC transporter permease [Nonomuraea sp. NPDC049129]|uniref:ABC transporter permease n=1 Tax=Nonomuraea sp. NPDC049129 TaxID=3155272 RepID=UPI0033FE88E1